MKLKDGHTYVTRSGVKRVVSENGGLFYDFRTKSLSPDNKDPELYEANGRWSPDGKKHRWDLVKEFKHAK